MTSGSRLWLMQIGTLSFNDIEGDEWEDMYEKYKNMYRATGVKRRNDHQKAQALWEMKAARDRGEEFFCERNKTSLGLLEEHLKDPFKSLEKALQHLEFPPAWLKSL